MTWKLKKNYSGRWFCCDSNLTLSHLVIRNHLLTRKKNLKKRSSPNFHVDIYLHVPFFLSFSLSLPLKWLFHIICFFNLIFFMKLERLDRPNTFTSLHCILKGNTRNKMSNFRISMTKTSTCIHIYICISNHYMYVYIDTHKIH